MDENTSAIILVIDDEEIVHSSIKRILTRIGYKIDGAFTAKEGLEKLAQNKYDAVITDLMMPEMNGVELLHTMQERAISTPAIMVTGYPTIKTALQALRLGAVDYIPKPFTRQELLSPLSRALRRPEVASTEVDKNDGQNIEQEESNEPDPTPNDCFYLHEHSWAIYNQDGTLDIGVEAGFLASIPEIQRIEAPMANDLIEQGYTGFKLITANEIHGVFMPLSGQVTQVNNDALSHPASLNAKTWVLKIIPNQLKSELASLRRRIKC